MNQKVVGPGSVMACISFTIALVAALLFASIETALAAETELSEEDQGCLKCHGDENLKQTLPNGKTRSLYVSARDFAASVHLNDGCAACHSEYDEVCLEKAQEEDRKVFETKRAHSLDLMQGCVDCHKKAVERYEESVHAALLKNGDAEKANKTAICSDCHNAHTERFFEARNKCQSCHEETASEHRDWLPKTERHLQTVACESCHAPKAQRRVNLRVYEGDSPLAPRVGVPLFKKVAGEADPPGARLDSRALWSLLKDFSEEDGAGKTVVRGKLEVKSAAEGHQLKEKSEAIKACSTCHSPRAEAFKSVTVSIVGPDGRTLHAPADRALLNSLESLESVGGFYVLGATRIKLLDTALILVLLAGTGGPLAHFTIRMAARRVREKREAREKTGEFER